MKKTHNAKKFMSYNGRVIWYTVVHGVTYYLVAKGNGTDAVFNSHLEAMDYIDNIQEEKI